ncbi:outer membrane protein assembly factor BamD [Prosthecochloris sp. ZM_2]|uniref:outer membrane protein assembly factor BamD n=1 Tax=Prosthecochloris sp. ZM_2 TaxID=2045206 RepID=UPI000DF7C3D3|nr:outer membrane protein assembly factor BamD [Prosthecochloris sp. ZM_2]RNA65656.1 outer membrane protein assembly factor BamD [Prosthecochloris sp. ZM_2]
MMQVLRGMTSFRGVAAGTSLVVALSFSACSSSAPSAQGDLSSRYSYARQLIDREKYDQAIVELEPLMFAARATTIEDEILFSLAESYYRSEQYLLAIEIYRRLLEQTPGSPYAPDAQFMLAKSHKELSPVFARDQEHTRKAIREFSLYLDLYPLVKEPEGISEDIEMYRGLLELNPDNASYRRQLVAAEAELARAAKVRESRESIAELREKLAHNRYAIAEQYITLDEYRAAEVFYDDILRNFPDTAFFEQAWRGKIDALIRLGKWYEARAALEAYDQRFPENMERVEDYREKILKHFDNS